MSQPAVQAAACVDSDTLVALLEGALPADRAEELDAHVDGCAACAAVVAELGALTGGGPRRVGRYVLERTIGAGAMGVVWAAWDPELQRRVAVKLVRGRGGAPRETIARARMVREARALARVNHPNVVAVHDVGEHDGEVFVATELVDGETMAQWQLGRGWREVVLAWVQAARGLAAAHAEGLVHRDVKPANVFVGRDGRVRVGDFGLARTDISDAPTEDSRPASNGDLDAGGEVAHGSGPPRSSDIPQLTATGHVAGTPGYMAPEQRRGPVDARADQFALCVAVVEALSGRRPPPDTRPVIRDVPAELIAVLARGLRADPVARFPTIGALADALAAAAAEPSVVTAAEPPRAPRRWVAIGVAFGTAVAAAIVAFVMLSDPERPATQPVVAPAPVAPAPGPVITPGPAPEPAPVLAAGSGSSPEAPVVVEKPAPTKTPPKPRVADRGPDDGDDTAAGTGTGTRVALDPMITPSTLVYSTFADKAGQDAQTARDQDDGAACLAALGAEASTDSPARIVLRGTCEMMVGKCVTGSKRIRAIGFQNKAAVDLGMKWIERNYCPSTEGSLATRVHRYEAQAVVGTRVSYSPDRYMAQLLALTDDAGVANVPAEPILGASDGPTVLAKGYMRLVPFMRTIGKCDKAAALEAKANSIGINIPDDPSGKMRCP